MIQRMPWSSFCEIGNDDGEEVSRTPTSGVEALRAAASLEALFAFVGS